MRLRSVSITLTPLLSATLLVAAGAAGCGGREPRTPSATPRVDASGEPFGDAASGPADPGETVDPMEGADPFDGGAGEAGDADSAPCEDDTGDASACAALGGGSNGCLTAALCDALPGLLSPRTAGLAMDCLAHLSDCGDGPVGDCVAAAAQQACAPAAPGSAPCGPLESVCATGDSLGTVLGCLSLAPALTDSAQAAMETCLNDRGECSSRVLGECAETLLP